MKQITNTSKLIVVTRQDLQPGYILAQSLHAVIDFILKYPAESQNWNSLSNYLVCLTVKDETSLLSLCHKLTLEDIKHVMVREPDIDNQITSIAIEPCDRARKICSNMPLALKEYTQGLNKNTYKQQTT